MAVERIVPFALIAVVVTFVSHTGMTSARATGLQRDALSQLLSKRNSWWSKKSVDSSSDFPAFVPDTSIDAEDVAENSPEEEEDTQFFVAVCYSSSCVPEFTACATHSRTTAAFDLCRLQKRQCALRCFQLLQDDMSPMK
ncbi:uncharacterized protein LOC143295137 [Babylonia areolata]|uniref:uncharacterized protein LOC143295137 n=1 Tax=Babylonia areolata TaxID=304850 RepID=UPI003FD3E930